MFLITPSSTFIWLASISTQNPSLPVIWLSQLSGFHFFTNTPPKMFYCLKFSTFKLSESMTFFSDYTCQLSSSSIVLLPWLVNIIKLPATPPSIFSQSSTRHYHWATMEKMAHMCPVLFTTNLWSGSYIILFILRFLLHSSLFFLSCCFKTFLSSSSNSFVS